MNSEGKVEKMAESHFLAACIREPDLAVKAVLKLTLDDFCLIESKAIFVAMQKVVQAGSSISFSNVASRLENQEHVDRLFTLPVTSVIRSNFQQYFFDVRELSGKRTMAKIAHVIGAYSQNGKSAAEIYSFAVESFGELKPKSERFKVRTLDEAAEEYDEFCEHLQTGEVSLIEIPFETISDEVTLYPCNTMVIGAWSSHGKTAFATEIALANARKGKRVLFVSLEMSPDEMIKRIASTVTETGIGLIKANTNRIIAHHAMATLRREIVDSGGALTIAYMPTANELDVEDTFKETYNRGGVDLIILDYIQRLNSSKQFRGDRRQQMGHLSGWTRVLNGQNKCAMIILSQLTRPDSKSRKQRRKPTIWDLKEAGELENDADVVILLYRDSVDPDDYDWLVNVEVAKNRNGFRCEEQFYFNSKVAKWKCI